MCSSDETAAKCTQGSDVDPNIQKITDEVIIAYLHCKYKAHLILTGVAREPSDHERWLRSFETKYIEAATKSLLDRESHGCTPSNREPATRNSLAQGETIILGPRVEEDSLLFAFDALQRVAGASSLGPFHYVPVMFCGTGRSVGKMQKVLLACGALILEKLQRVRPAYGIIIHGHSYKIRKVILDSELLNAQKVINDLTDYLCRQKKPRLWLNGHCHVCRYRSECRVEAKQLDDLSLLNRMSEREIQLYNRKGIFSVHQLSHTFRFKKRAKRVKAHGRPHSFPLQALAIRERSVFVLSRPAIQPASTYIYVDMEGNHTGSFIYLIGALVVDDDGTRYHSFWANSVHEEEHLFAEFLQFLAQFNGAHLFHYGSYEAKAFQRILTEPAENKGKLLMMGATNVLSLIYANVYFPTYSNELKEIAKYLGCEWSDPDSTGLSAAIWRAEWESSNDTNLKNRLISYNEQDCLAVQGIREFLSAMPENDQMQEMSDGSIRFVDRIKIDDDQRLFGKKKFAVEDFSIVTERAYFDYQRDKIYIRTSPSLKRVKQRAKRKRKRYRLRPNKAVNLRSL
jgi:predicted RecB family nuclease